MTALPKAHMMRAESLPQGIHLDVESLPPLQYLSQPRLLSQQYLSVYSAPCVRPVCLGLGTFVGFYH